MNKLLFAIAIILILAGCQDSSETAINTTPEKKQLSEQEIALRVNDAKTKFVEKFDIDANTVSEPILYDINNDGNNEIVLFTEKHMSDEAEPYYIGIYSLNDGSELTLKKYESNDMIRIFKLSNPTYHNTLAVFQISAGSAAFYTADVLNFQNNALTTVASVATECGDPFDDLLTDVDKDGFEEFKGLENDYGPGSDRLTHAARVSHDVVYSWDASQNVYEPAVYGEDGITDEQRDFTGELTKEKAVQIVNVAQSVQMSWLNPIATEEEIHKLMRPFFSNNFIYEFMKDGVLFNNEYNGYLPNYTEGGDTTWLVPSYSSNAELRLLEDGTSANLIEDIEQSFEDGSYKVQAIITLVKTKYGWKIDKLEYKEPTTIT